MKPKAKWEHERQDCLLTKKNLKSPRTTEKPADRLWSRSLENAEKFNALGMIRVNRIFQLYPAFSAFWKLMNAHFSKNSCYSRYSIINEWPHWATTLGSIPGGAALCFFVWFGCQFFYLGRSWKRREFDFEFDLVSMFPVCVFFKKKKNYKKKLSTVKDLSWPSNCGKIELSCYFLFFQYSCCLFFSFAEAYITVVDYIEYVIRKRVSLV